MSAPSARGTGGGAPREHETGGAGGTPETEGPCLLTGATGFIGGRLAVRLHATRRSVRCLARATSDTASLRALGLEIATGDLTDPASLASAAEGCATVVHCAAMVTDWATVAELRAANVAGTRNLATAAARAGARRFVHVSTTDVYGHPGGAEVDESYRGEGFANWYSQTKLEAEEALAATAAAEELPWTVLRPATVYGPGSVEVVGEIAKAIRAGHMLLIDRGRAIAGLLYVENLIDAILLALDAPAAVERAFNLSDDLDVTWGRFTADLAAGLGCRPPRLSLPYAPAAALGRAFELGYRGLRRSTGLRTAPLLSRQAVQVLGRNQRFCTHEAAATLGWRPRVGYDEGLAATLEWLRERP